MFTWICPKCGREVPPAYTDCPDCTKKAAEAPAEQTPEISATTPLEPAPVRQAAPPPAAPAPVRYAPPVPRGGLPTWLMAVLFAFAFGGLGAGIYWLVGNRQSPAGGGPAATVESPTAKTGARTHPYQKYIEVAGVRFVENAKKKPEVKFVVVNHSAAELDGLTGNVTLWGRTQKSEEDAAGTFTFTTNLKPWETKDLSAPLTTKHRIYELPDWQNVSADIQITAPVVSGGSAAPR